MTRPKIYIRDRIYVPVNSVDPDRVKHKYTRHMYKDSACRQCEYLPDRPCAVCQTCPNYEGVVKLWSVRSIKGNHYIGLPVGDKESLEKRASIDYDDHEIVDLRRKVPFDYNIKFTAELRPAQVKLASDFLKKKYGLLEAPPRTGKTVMLLYLGLMLGQRMVLLANQHEYLQQFLWHIEGNEAEGIIKCTNLPEIQERSGKKLYGFPKTDEDFATMQLMVMTYQSLASEEKGSNRLKLLSKNVGTVAVDEVHRAGANVFSSILNKFYTRYRFGVTGTVARKDLRHVITERIMGPVTSRATVEAMIPKVFIKETGIKIKRVPKLWVYMMKALTNSEPRNKMIVDRCVKDVRAGHSVVIPLTFVNHIHDMVRRINEAYGEPIAKAFVGGGAGEKQKEIRRKILSEAKSGEIKVVVGTRSLLQLGLNVPRWSALYLVIPISNKPNLLQETSRIRTPMDGKRQPILRLFYDQALGASVGCARNSVTHMREFKYQFSTDKYTAEALGYLAQANRRNSVNEDDDFKPQRLIDDEEQTSMGRAGRR